MVASDTFRLPYFHRNYMSEFMGLLEGEYEGKPTESKPIGGTQGFGFAVGGASLHNRFCPHGPSVTAYQKCLTAKAPNEPVKLTNTLAFMLESSDAWRPSEASMLAQEEGGFLQNDYIDSTWDGFEKAQIKHN
eukprot:Platyproteum_vivax@DN2816_c0_g1_i1.p3